MELKSKVKRTRRLEKNRKRLCQNGLFQQHARWFYRELGKQIIQVTSPPSESEIEQYWGGILETEVHHNESAFWLRRQTDGETHRRDEHIVMSVLLADVQCRPGNSRTHCGRLSCFSTDGLHCSTQSGSLHHSLGCLSPFEVPVESRWYHQHPERLVETDDITMMWDTTIPLPRRSKPIVQTSVSEIKRQTLVFLLTSAALLMATLVRNMLRSWQVQLLASEDKPHVALSNTGGSSGLESFGRSAHRYCTVAGHYSRSSQPAALTENSAFGI